MNKALKAILFLIGSAILTRFIPFSSWFRTLDTTIHELGHAVVTLLLSGHVLRIELNADHSGVTYTQLSYSWQMIVTSLAGYMIASLFAVLMFYGYAKRKQGPALLAISALAVIMLLFFVRSGYGLWWLCIFIVINLAAYFLGKGIRNFYYLLLAFLCLEESVIGPFSLAINALFHPGQAGDASNLARYTAVPAVVWASLFTLFSLWCAIMALSLFWKKREVPKNKMTRTESL